MDALRRLLPCPCNLFCACFDGACRFVMKWRDLFWQFLSVFWQFLDTFLIVFPGFFYLFDRFWSFLIVCDRVWQLLDIFWDVYSGLVMVFDRFWQSLIIFDRFWSFSSLLPTSKSRASFWQFFTVFQSEYFQTHKNCQRRLKTIKKYFQTIKDDKTTKIKRSKTINEISKVVTFNFETIKNDQRKFFCVLFRGF